MNGITIAVPISGRPARTGNGFSLQRQLLTWWQRARQRRQLAEMEDWQLRDIGLARETAQREAARPFWE
ncbi:MAG: DUF1127 domain-containing protein [Gammaproteobacteria bacterium]|nr:DUF1127 domain-containing protein [Gammaproteobacteria bacterium]